MVLQSSTNTHSLSLIYTHITYNSALDASPPKASKLPEVILSSMDLFAKTYTDPNHIQKFKANMSTKLVVCTVQGNEKQTCKWFYSHSPDRLSLSLTKSWGTSSVNSSLRHNRDSKHQNVHHQLLSWSFIKIWQSSTVLLLLEKTCLKWFVECYIFGAWHTEHYITAPCSVWNSPSMCKNRPWNTANQALRLVHSPL